MMAGLREWLMAVIALSLVCAGAESLMPPGGVRTVGRLVCGMALLCVMLRPVGQLRGVDVEQLLRGCARWTQLEEQELSVHRDRSQKAVIEQACETYIADKGVQLGLVCRAEVDCEAGEDGIYLPRRARLWGDFDAVTQSRLTELLWLQLGIPVEEQSYYLTEEGAG